MASPFGSCRSVGRVKPAALHGDDKWMTGVISRCLQRDRQIDVQSQRQKQRVDPGRRRRVPQSAVPLGTVAVINSHQLGAIDHPPDRRLPCAHRKVRHTPAQLRHHDGKGAGTEREGERPLRICPFALSRARAEPLLRCVGVCCSGSAGPTMTCLQVQPSVPTGAPSGHSPAFGVENHVPIPLQRPNVMSKCFRRMGQLVAHVCGAQAWVGGGGGGGKAAREGEGE